ncbi:MULTISPECIES: nuclear transport factor 2 family protein [Salinibaculum]|uniref:nuclear transport factor 2 family protein n=1 Tax=Salinibaculum TaxID=2732368 RepID=UPI0030D4B062
MGAGDVVDAYYDSLRAGDPLAPYFSDAGTTVKFGISESLWGGTDVATALQAQTERTADWTVESRNLTVDRQGETAWFADDVFMAWTDTERRIRYEFDTRWSGTLVRGEGDDQTGTDGWQFVGMHVSTAGDL